MDECVSLNLNSAKKKCLCFVFHPKLESGASRQSRTKKAKKRNDHQNLHAVGIPNFMSRSPTDATQSAQKENTQQNIEYLIKWQGQFFYDIKINETFIT